MSEASMAETVQASAPATPTEESERISSLDVLRGIAILGILIMNIQMFAMIDSAYFNPTAYGDLTGVNLGVWTFSQVFASMKFLTIFSMLYGAGIVLLTARVEARGLKPAGVHYRRTFWLLIIGLAHAYLLWHGDILVPYALCALVVYLFRRMSPKWLLIFGIISLSVASAIYLLVSATLPFWPPEATEQMGTFWNPSPETVGELLAVYRGGWTGQLLNRIVASFMVQTSSMLAFIGWRAGGCMLIGMALYKWGVLSAQRSARFYIIGAVAGLIVGLPLTIFGITRDFATGWSVESSLFGNMHYNYWGSLFTAFAYICLVMLICRQGYLKRITSALAPVGRMAFTNYLFQSLIGTFLFYGQGFALYGKVDRWAQLLIVFAIWAVLIPFSNYWLKRYRFGPVEWLWRSLTYKKYQPMRRREPGPLLAEA